MRKVLIGTPSYDGKVDVWYCDSLLRTIKQSYKENTYVHAIYTSYDSLVQRARNSLVKLALEGDYDDLFFIDADVEWDEEWVFRFLNRPEPIIGAALVKKNDVKEGYTIKLTDKKLKYSADGKLINADAVGTGFMKVSRFALEKLWAVSEIYYDTERSTGTEENRMIFDIKVENGDLIGEDYVLCNKWKSLGYNVWLDPTITCNHLGIKKYKGNLQNFLTEQGYE